MGEEYYISKPIKRQLDQAKIKVVKGDQDRLYVIDGREGSGKSTLAQQLAAYVDESFNLNRIVFNSEDFKKLIKTIPQYSAVVFDEAFNGLSSKGSLSKENKRLVQLLMECRQKNLFIFIVLPSIFLLEKYVAIFRSTALFHTSVSRKDVKNRSYQIYNYAKKSQLYLYGKQMLTYSRPWVDERHRFYGKTPACIDRSEYVKKKLAAFEVEDAGKSDSPEGKMYMQRNICFYHLNKKMGMSHNDISEMLGKYGVEISQSGITRAIGATGLKK